MSQPARPGPARAPRPRPRTQRPRPASDDAPGSPATPVTGPPADHHSPPGTAAADDGSQPRRRHRPKKPDAAAARRRGRALGHCRRAVGRRRRRTLHGGPLRRRSGNTDTAAEAGHGAAGTVVTRGGRRNAGWRYLRARRLAIPTERPVAPQGPARRWRPGNRRARPGLMPPEARPSGPGQSRPHPRGTRRRLIRPRGRPSPSRRAGRRKITVTITSGLGTELAAGSPGTQQINEPEGA